MLPMRAHALLRCARYGASYAMMPIIAVCAMIFRHAAITRCRYAAPLRATLAIMPPLFSRR